MTHIWMKAFVKENGMEAGGSGICREAGQFPSPACSLHARNQAYDQCGDDPQNADRAVIINTARGGIIDEEALAAALESGKIAAAALDAFEQEPVVDSPLLKFDNVIMTPHTGARIPAKL